MKTGPQELQLGEPTPRPSGPIPPPSTPVLELLRLPRPTTTVRHVRAAGLLLLLTVLTASLVIPVVVTEFADLVTPGTAHGSLVTRNGTVIGSSLIAQNVSTPYLFWARPSLNDYNVTLGTTSPPGPSESALRDLLNLTLSYMRTYGTYTVNASLPLGLVSPSGSGVDPDLTPEAVLVQIPRIAHFSLLSIGTLMSLVEAHIQHPIAGFIGPAYVNVLQLDLALLPLEGR